MTPRRRSTPTTTQVSLLSPISTFSERWVGLIASSMPSWTAEAHDRHRHLRNAEHVSRVRLTRLADHEAGEGGGPWRRLQEDGSVDLVGGAGQ